MTKQEVLEIFHKAKGFVRPDMVWRRLRGFHHRSSVYSYLFRLHRQGLLHRQMIHGRIAYWISQRGIERLQFFRERQRSHRPQEIAGVVQKEENGRK